MGGGEEGGVPSRRGVAFWVMMGREGGGDGVVLELQLDFGVDIFCLWCLCCLTRRRRQRVLGKRTNRTLTVLQPLLIGKVNGRDRKRQEKMANGGMPGARGLFNRHTDSCRHTPKNAFSQGTDPGFNGTTGTTGTGPCMATPFAGMPRSNMSPMNHVVIFEGAHNLALDQAHGRLVSLKSEDHMTSSPVHDTSGHQRMPSRG